MADGTTTDVEGSRRAKVGGGDGQADVTSRRLVFNTAPVKIDLEIQRGSAEERIDVDGRLQINGQFFPRRDISANGFSVRLTRDDDEVAAATTAHDGAFAFREITPGRYGVKFYTRRLGFHLRPVALYLPPAEGAVEGLGS